MINIKEGNSDEVNKGRKIERSTARRTEHKRVDDYWDEREAKESEDAVRRSINRKNNSKPAPKSFHAKAALVSGGTLLAGYASLKIKAMKCKKKCNEIKDPKLKGRCLEDC